jgi:transposase
MVRRAYRLVGVKTVSAAKTLESLAAGAVYAGVDIGKKVVVTVLRDTQGRFLRPWKTAQPSEVRDLVALLVEIAADRPLVIAMESTGTYGDALRQALTDAGLTTHRVSGKAVKDYAEIFDGVPSNHDGKDAAIIAELAALGKSSAWPYRRGEAWEEEVDYWVDWLDSQQRVKQTWLGRLEAILARHWPEATRILSLSSATLVRVLMVYGGPRWLAEDAAASKKLSTWGGRFWPAEKQALLLESARTTIGVRMNDQDRLRIQHCAQECRRADREIRKAKRALKKLTANDEALARQASAIGATTACVLRVALGDVREYSSGPAYRKAMGLNLKERSSGKFKGKLKLTKRGPSMARRWMFFAAMRILQQPAVRGWYEAKKARDSNEGLKAVIGVMRKLALAMYAVGAGGETFDPQRLFPGRSRRRKRKIVQNKERKKKTPGGSTPRPPGFSALGPIPEGQAKKKAGQRQVVPPPVSAPGSALGSVPTGALSSAGVNPSIVSQSREG